MIDILLIIVIGIAIGCVTGLLPGIHPNTFLPIALIVSPVLGAFNTAVLLLSMGIANSFVAFIPSIFLGAPEEATSLSILPGHRLLLEGAGHVAIKLTAIGGLCGALFSILFFPILLLFLPTMYSATRPFIHLVLLLAVFYMVWIERRPWIALAVFITSGALGYVSLNYGSSMLFPLLTGLFGMPVLLLSLIRNNPIPEQSQEQCFMEKARIIKSSLIGSMAGIVAGILPGFGVTQSTVLVKSILSKEKNSSTSINETNSFLISLGAVNISDVLYSIFAIYLISNPRSGIAVAIEKLIKIDMNTIIIFSIIAVFVALVSAVLCMVLSKIFLGILKKINYSFLSLLTCILLIFLAGILTGIEGLAVLLAASIIGVIAPLTGINRTHAMGSLILPTILWFAGIR